MKDEFEAFSSLRLACSDVNLVKFNVMSEDMAVEEDERRCSPLDLRRPEDEERPEQRFPFSISSLLERSEANREALQSDSEEPSESEARERLSGAESEGADEEEDPSQPFQPYTFTHAPFLLPHLGLFPPMSAAAAGLSSSNPLMSMASPQGVIRVPAHRPSVGSSPHTSLAGVFPQLGAAAAAAGPLPWLAGLTPLERTAAVAQLNLGALSPLTGESLCVL